MPPFRPFKQLNVVNADTPVSMSNITLKLLQASLAFCALGGAASVHAASAVDCPFSVVMPQVAPSFTVDGMALLRHSMDSGASPFTPNPSGITASAIRESLVAFGPRVDVDGSGAFDVRDAQIIARYLAGFRGEALTANIAAPAVAMTRPDAAGVLAFIEAGCPAASDAAADVSTALGFHDFKSDGTARDIRNDLTGSLSGMVEFVQSHSVNPSGNDDRLAPRVWPALTLPDIITHRTALVLFTPTAAQRQVTVVASANGVTQLLLPMQHPNALPRADVTPSDARTPVAYSRRAWSVELPWHLVKAGLTLTFVGDDRAAGVLAANALQFAAPAEVVVHNVQVGMLTAAPDSPLHALIRNPASFGTDYFQTLPAARLIVSSYEPVSLPRVITGTGLSFDTVYPTRPGVYGDALFSEVAVSQIMRGIQLANRGISSSPSRNNSGSDSYITAQHTALHSQGNYDNGVVQHGLLGGGGMVALLASRGNEFSHEIGHSFGMGHWPGARWKTAPEVTQVGDVMDAIHHADSGWGYLAHRKRMRANLQGSKPFATANVLDGYEAGIQVDVSSNNFQNQYHYNFDAMSGAADSHAISKYTHYTGYTAVRIQRNIDRNVADLAFASGYKAWDRATAQYVDAAVRSPGFSALRPARLGVPVHTVVGAYDPGTSAGLAPAANQSLLYTPLRGNYGHTFALPAPDFALSTRQCWLEVTFAALPMRRIKVDATRRSSSSVNAVSINIAQDEAPLRASLRCRINANLEATETLLSSVDFVAPAGLPPATKIGMEDGLSALRTQEIATLSALLETKIGVASPLLSAAEQLMFDSWSSDLTGLSPVATQVAQRLMLQQAAAVDITRYINANRASIAARDAATLTALRERLQRAGLVSGAASMFPAGATLAAATAQCVSINGAVPPAPVMTANCALTAQSAWWQDARGGIRSAARPDLCITGAARYAATTLTACDPTNAAQLWTPIAIGSQFRYEAAMFTGDQTLDAYGSGPAGLWSIGSGNNQRWSALPRSEDVAWVYLAAADLLLLKNAGL